MAFRDNVCAIEESIQLSKTYVFKELREKWWGRNGTEENRRELQVLRIEKTELNWKGNWKEKSIVSQRMEGFIGLGIIENVEKEIKTLKAKQEHMSLKIIAGPAGVLCVRRYCIDQSNWSKWEGN